MVVENRRANTGDIAMTPSNITEAEIARQRARVVVAEAVIDDAQKQAQVERERLQLMEEMREVY